MPVCHVLLAGGCWRSQHNLPASQCIGRWHVTGGLRAPCPFFWRASGLPPICRRPPRVVQVWPATTVPVCRWAAGQGHERAAPADRRRHTATPHHLPQARHMEGATGAWRASGSPVARSGPTPQRPLPAMRFVQAKLVHHHIAPSTASPLRYIACLHACTHAPPDPPDSLRHV